MADRFDPYREALVVETATVWPEELSGVGPAERERIEAALHADPARAAGLEYVRLYTGFCRRITVTPADVQRLAPGTGIDGTCRP
ncbi:MAG: hypothetical protein ABSG86_03085 [Thermoguttaceae bacterium]|jgi:hypothetical protein